MPRAPQALGPAGELRGLRPRALLLKKQQASAAQRHIALIAQFNRSNDSTVAVRNEYLEVVIIQR